MSFDRPIDFPREIGSVIEALRDARLEWRTGHRRNAEHGVRFPSRSALKRILRELSAALFPLRLGPPELTTANENAWVDATLETLKLARLWAPPHQPELFDGVWFSDRGEALLVVETRAAGFDPGAQAAAITSLQRHFAALPGAASATVPTTVAAVRSKASLRMQPTIIASATCSGEPRRVRSSSRGLAPRAAAGARPSRRPRGTC